MQLVLGELGTVVRVTSVGNGFVQTVGAGVEETFAFGIAPDGSMPVSVALDCPLACDWDPAWENADYYACDEPDELECSDPDSAIAEHFNSTDTDEHIQTAIEKACPLEVTAYQRESVTLAWLASTSLALFERFEEDYGAQYGCAPDRRPFDDEEIRTAATQRLCAVLRELALLTQPYNCTAVATKLYSADEVERVLRDECPEWFEDATALAATTPNVMSL